jgi:hypothetical protein
MRFVLAAVLGCLFLAPCRAGEKAEAPKSKDYARVEARGRIMASPGFYVLVVETDPKEPVWLVLDIGADRELADRLEELGKKRTPVVVTGRLKPVPPQERSTGHNGLYPTFYFPIGAILADVRVRTAE